MNGLLFTLVNAENANEVYAWGMEIVSYHRDTEKERRDAIVYRYDPVHDQTTHGFHDSAEAARNAHSRAIPIDLELIWQDDHLAAARSEQ